MGSSRLRLPDRHQAHPCGSGPAQRLCSLVLTAALGGGQGGVIISSHTRKQIIPSLSPSEGLNRAAKSNLTSNLELVMHEKQGRWHQDLK